MAQPGRAGATQSDGAAWPRGCDAKRWSGTVARVRRKVMAQPGRVGATQCDGATRACGKAADIAKEIIYLNRRHGKGLAMGRRRGRGRNQAETRRMPGRNQEETSPVKT